MDSRKIKKLVLNNLAYVIFGYAGNIISFSFRTAEGKDVSEKLLPALNNLSTAFAHIIPSFHPIDLLVGIAVGVAMKFVMKMRAANKKKFRQGTEYGSAVWGTEKDIEPYMDFKEKDNNVILTQTEGLTMGKPSHPKYARNKNILVIGGSGSGKTSTVILDTLLANYSAPEPEMLTFCIDIKGELHEKSTKKDDPAIYVVDPSDRKTIGWDAWYRLHGDPADDLIVESMEEIAEALIVSANPKDLFFVVNARSMFTGLLVYYFKKGESFIDAVNHILEADAKTLITEIIEESVKSDLWYQYLAKFAGKKAESVEDCMVEMTTNLSVFSKSDVKFCFRDNAVKASPSAFKENKSIFLAIPEHLLGSYQAIMRLCTAQVLQDLQRRPDADAAAKPILVLIDEFARLGRVETIFNALATLRSKKTMVMLAFQSMAQMEVIYSKEEARVIADNCRIKVICECADPDTAKDISAWCGNYQNKKETLNSGKNRSKSYTYEEKPIVEQGDLITLVKKEEVILIISGIGYLRPKKCYYFKDRKISSLADQVREFNQRR